MTPVATNRRHQVLGAVLAATVAATAWLALQPDEGADLARPAPVVRSTAQGAPASALSTPATRLVPRPTIASSTATTATASAVDMSTPPRAAWPAAGTAAAESWGLPPPPPPQARIATAPVRKAAPAEPEPPRAPAFPYTLIGQLDDGRPQALLTGPLRSLAVGAGEVVDGQWRIDAIQAQSITFTWLPGGQRQTLGFKPS